MTFLNPFRRDARMALLATPVRRIISSVPLLLLMVAAIILGDRVAWWVWPTLVLVDLLVFAFVSNAWANRDALDAEQRE